MKKFNKLREEGNNKYRCYRRTPFKRLLKIKQKYINKAFEFAYDMAYGDGYHRRNRSGGQHQRKDTEIFANTLQGKISEFGFYQYFKDEYEISKPDLSIDPKGIWDDADIIINNSIIAIKSTKYKNDLLLLETKDWSEKGEYIPNSNSEGHSKYDYIFLTRVKPSVEKNLKSKRLLYSNKDNINKENLIFLKKLNWEFDIPGYIKREDLINIIKKDFILPQNSILNFHKGHGGTNMDAENYYIQSKDLRNIKK